MADTNVLLSAFALRGAGATQLVRVAQRQYHLLVADYSFEELESFYRTERMPGLQALHAWRHSGAVTMVRSRPFPVPPIADEKDKPILEAAVAAKPDFFVTQDRKHFHTTEIRRVLDVVTVYEMLRLLGR